MKQVIKWIGYLNKGLGVIVGLMMGVMAILIIAQIGGRFFDMPIHWSEELARYLMVYVVMLGAALALGNNRLIAIEVLPELLGPKKRRWLKIGLILISMFFFIILFMEGVAMTDRVQMQTAAGLGISMSIPYAAIPVGAFFLFINSISVLLQLITSSPTEEKAPEEGVIPE